MTNGKKRARATADGKILTSGKIDQSFLGVIGVYLYMVNYALKVVRSG